MQMPNEVVFIYLENLDSDFGEIKIQFKRWSKKLGPKLRKAFLQFYINHTAGADTKTIVQKLEKLFTEFVWSQGWNSENEKGIQKEKSQLLKIFGKLLPAKTVSDKRYSKFAKPILNRLDRKNSSELELQQKEIINAETNFLEKEKDEIAVQNAGLILLHPFLRTFFIRTEIADEFGNINPQKLDLAIQSLHFLATGKENVFESNLVFEKFLCGVPLKIPVARQSLITDEIKDLAEDLLKAVIGHWQAIGNTSPDGLRESFLQRNGKLIRNENNYKLIIERKVYDMLLDKLTWNISMVKLNWIKELITVEW
jgi:hypothetical protein